MKPADSTPASLITCPVCHRHIRAHRTLPICLSHCDKTGQPCPMSGQSIGAIPE